MSLSNKVFAYWCLEFKKKVSLTKIGRVDTFLIFINGLRVVFISGRIISILFSFDVCLANVLFSSNSLASCCVKSSSGLCLDSLFSFIDIYIKEIFFEGILW